MLGGGGDLGTWVATLLYPGIWRTCYLQTIAIRPPSRYLASVPPALKTFATFCAFFANCCSSGILSMAAAKVTSGFALLCLVNCKTTSRALNWFSRTMRILLTAPDGLLNMAPTCAARRPIRAKKKLLEICSASCTRAHHYLCQVTTVTIFE
ncbi:hypothetical protein BDZ91DRAFT_743083 [Kalaharituber pfeilii]|nr:hypothetical protein BDZ91DRAFT_743083 [Kalaharituber pfeilii]